VLASAAAALVFAAPPAVVAQAPCTGVHVEASSALSGPWSAAVRDLEEQLSRLPAAECARVALSIGSTDTGATIVATAADGRRAERAVTQPASLAPTALGLVASIPGDSPVGTPDRGPLVTPLAASPSPPSSPSPARDSVVTAASESAYGRSADGASLKPIAVWLGFAVGGRAAQPSPITMADLEARADIVVAERWLIIASFRYTPVGATSFLRIDNDQYQEESVGLGFGRRVHLGPGTFDFAVSPSLVAMRMEGDFDGDVDQDEVQFRLDGSARWLIPFSSDWRVTLTFDADVAPADAAHPVREDPRLPALPTWTTGLRVGMTGALL
jgi:hypothetical protein